MSLPTPPPSSKWKKWFSTSSCLTSYTTTSTMLTWKLSTFQSFTRPWTHWYKGEITMVDYILAPKNNDEVEKSHVIDMEPLAKQQHFFSMSKASTIDTSTKVNAKIRYSSIILDMRPNHPNHHNGMQVMDEWNSPYPDPDITMTNHESPPFASKNDCQTFIIEETCNHPRLAQTQHMYKCYWLG